MKHLNPRQGITIRNRCHTRTLGIRLLCETPKSPPGDYNVVVVEVVVVAELACETPKSPPGDYNPFSAFLSSSQSSCVKHLNPRQGITIERRAPLR